MNLKLPTKTWKAAFYLLLLIIPVLHPAYIHSQQLSDQAYSKISQPDIITNHLQIYGAVPVIIKMDVPALNGIPLKAQDKSVVMESIREVRNHILSQADIDDSHRFKSFDTVPLLSLFADAETVEKLASSSDVLQIYPDRLFKPALGESTEIIGANIAWNHGYTGEGQVIVILDTGVDSDHPFLHDKVIAEACFSATFESVGATSFCPRNSNDDGFYFSDASTSGDDCNIDNLDVGEIEHNGIEGCPHGTTVAGVAAGKNGVNGINGVAPDAEIISIQIFTYFDNDDPAYCGNNNPCIRSYESDQIAALDYVNSNLTDDYIIASVNFSIAGFLYEEACNDYQDFQENLMKPIIDNLRNKKIPTIISSGNNGSEIAISAPACISTAISTAATDKNDNVWSGSNTSSTLLDLLAPGTGIQTSEYGGSYRSVTGTSYAAHHVAGAWALMKQAYPESDIEDILSILKNTGIPITRGGSTFPRIQVDEALSQNFIAEIAPDEHQQNEGWRLLSSPTLTTYSNFLSGIWTQGPANSAFENGDFSNVLHYNGTDYVSVQDMEELTQAGQGIAVYVYADDDFNGTPDTWPKELSFRGPEVFGSVDVSGLINPGTNIFSLLGNPFNSTINFDHFEIISDIGNVVYVYDHSCDSLSSPDTDGGTEGGCFRAWNGIAGSLSDGLIAPYQGFFVLATGSNPQLVIPASAKSTENATFYKDTNPVAALQIAARMDGKYSSDTWFSFTDSGTLTHNNYDAPMLYPVDYKPFLAFFSEKNGTTYTIKNLPAALDKPIRIPIGIQAWQPNGSHTNPGYIPLEGSVELIWPTMDNIPAEWSLILEDHYKGNIIQMERQAAYRFEHINTSFKLDVMPYEMSMKQLMAESPVNNRFTLHIHPYQTIDPYSDQLPAAITLNQNYPNPFNPVTVIRYELPEPSDIAIDVFTINGQKVATLFNGTQNAGIHNVTFDATSLSSGVYMYRLTTRDVIHTRRMVLIK